MNIKIGDAYSKIFSISTDDIRNFSDITAPLKIHRKLTGHTNTNFCSRNTQNPYNSCPNNVLQPQGI